MKWKFCNYYTVLLANGGRKITFGPHQFTVITVMYISRPTFIHSWSISKILGYKFFCLGHLGTSRQWISASQRRPQNFLQSSSWFGVWISTKSKPWGRLNRFSWPSQKSGTLEVRGGKTAASFFLKKKKNVGFKVMRAGSDTFANPFIKKVLQC